MRKNSLLVLTIVSTLVLGTLIVMLSGGEVQAKPCTQGGVINQPSLHNVPCTPDGGGIGIYSFICGGCNMRGISLPGVDLSNAWLRQADFSNQGSPALVSNLEAINLTNASLLNAQLQSANLTGANLTGANLTGANLTGAILTNADFLDANLTNADLASADFTDANLTNADLQFATLTNTNLTNADLTNADLNFTDLSSVIWNNTICPDGFNSDDNGGDCDGHL